MARRLPSLQNDSLVGIDREIGSQYDNVKLVADNLASVLAVAGINGSVTVVSSIAGAVVALNSISEKLTSLYEDKPVLDSLYADKAILDSLFADKETLDSLFTDKETLDALYADKAVLDRLYTSIDNIERVYTSIDNVDTVAAEINAVTTVANDTIALNEVYDNRVEIYAADDNAAIATAKANEASLSAAAAETAQGITETARDTTLGYMTAVEALYDAFDDRFLGSKSVNPTTDNDGEPLVDGTLYFDTTNNLLKVYDTGTGAWLDIPNMSIATLGDVTLTSPITGDVLSWNGTTWVNADLTSSDINYDNVTSGLTATDAQSAIDEVEGRLDTAESKLSGIESGATADQTASEIETLYEGQLDTNKYTDAEKAKVALIDQDLRMIAMPTFAGVVTSGTVDGRDVSVDGAKLDTIEDNATRDQTASEIESLYESIADTNKYTDAEQAKVGHITITADRDLDDLYTTDEINTLLQQVTLKVKAQIAITKGQALMYHGYSESETAMKVKPTISQSDVCVGIAQADMAADSFGTIVTTGLITDIDTSAYTVGQILYSNGSGGYTTTRPATSYQAVAYVLRSHAATGSILVSVNEPVKTLEEIDAYIDAYTKSEADAILDTVHLTRADKYLAAQSVANMLYTDNKLTKVRYAADSDADYEVLSYNTEGKLVNVAHYVSTVLEGNTVLSYTAGKLSSAIYTGV